MSGRSDAAALMDDRQPQPARKKRKHNFRACDACRKRKVRCDGSDMPGNQCSFCVEHDIECTNTQEQPRKAPSLSFYKGQAQRAMKLEVLIKRLIPDIDITAELEKLNTEQADFAWTSMASTGDMTLERNSDQASIDKASQPEDDIEQDSLLLPDDFSRMNIRANRFHGKSSAAMLLQKAMEKTGVQESVSDSFRDRDVAQLWIELPWNHDFYQKRPPTLYTYPDEDLMLKLVDIYLSDVNLFRPLLHRPTFVKSVTKKLFLEDDTFGAVVLLVCASASKKCDDPRVFHRSGLERCVRGWHWFEQARIQAQSFITPSTLYEVQAYVLMADYINSNFGPQGAWTLVGLGLRAAQDVGAHSRKMYAPPLTIEKELWRRAWWILIHLDRVYASSLGRPVGIHDEEFDVEFPIECDDEHWEHPDPSQAWRQPPGQPATVSYFVQKVKLIRILGRALRTVHAVDKSKVYQGLVGEDWEQRVVAELDSSLNMWMDSLPDHLRWNPQCENALWLHQSVLLFADYYLLQIFVHMPFITTKESPLSFPSLAICSNAARACSHLFIPDDPRLQCGMSGVVWPMFICTIVLLMNIWGGKKAGIQLDLTKALRDIQTCQDVMERFKERFLVSRRLWFVLRALTADLNLHLASFRSSKRMRDGLPQVTVTSPTEKSESAMKTPMRSSQAPVDVLETGMIDDTHKSQSQRNLWTLPFSTSDLQRIPFYSPPSSTASPQGRQPPVDDTAATFDLHSPQVHDDPSSSFAAALHQLPFFDVHADWGSGFSDLQSILDDTNVMSTPLSFDGSPSGSIPYQGQQLPMPMESDSPTWQQASHPLGQTNWEEYLSNVSELLKDIESREPQQ